MRVDAHGKFHFCISFYFSNVEFFSLAVACARALGRPDVMAIGNAIVTYSGGVAIFCHVLLEMVIHSNCTENLKRFGRCFHTSVSFCLVCSSLLFFFCLRVLPLVMRSKRCLFVCLFVHFVCLLSFFLLFIWNVDHSLSSAITKLCNGLASSIYVECTPYSAHYTLCSRHIQHYQHKHTLRRHRTLILCYRNDGRCFHFW